MIKLSTTIIALHVFGRSLNLFWCNCRVCMHVGTCFTLLTPFMPYLHPHSKIKVHYLFIYLLKNSNQVLYLFIYSKIKIKRFIYLFIFKIKLSALFIYYYFVTETTKSQLKLINDTICMSDNTIYYAIRDKN